MSGPGKTFMRRLQGVMFKLPLMITCAQFEDFIVSYLDGQLPARQRRLFELHLRICRECRDYLAAYRASMVLTKSALRTENEQDLQAVPEDLGNAGIAARHGRPPPQCD